MLDTPHRYMSLGLWCKSLDCLAKKLWNSPNQKLALTARMIFCRCLFLGIEKNPNYGNCGLWITVATLFFLGGFLPSFLLGRPTPRSQQIPRVFGTAFLGDAWPSRRATGGEVVPKTEQNPRKSFTGSMLIFAIHLLRKYIAAKLDPFSMGYILLFCYIRDECIFGYMKGWFWWQM